jgi:hypothetical protein
MEGNHNDETVVRLLRDLPNFPRDVVEQWIGYYAESEGWPPPQPLTGRWAALLDYRPLCFWRALTWSEELLAPSVMPFTLHSVGSISQIIDAHTKNAVNDYSKFMGEEGKPRFAGLLTFVIQHGYPPKNPIVIRESGQYEVMDGNHRLAAYIAWSRCCQIDAFIKKLGCTTASLRDKIPIWVGS